MDFEILYAETRRSGPLKLILVSLLSDYKKKCSELKSLGVAIGVAYSSAKTNGLCIIGDRQITQVIEKHKDEILLNPDWMEEDEGSLHQVILPPLPDKLDHLNSITKKAMIQGLMMDLKISWDSPRPTWWPAEIPFRNFITQPEG